MFRCLLILLVAPWLLRAQDLPAPLSTARAVRELDRAAAAQGLPARVRGVVTFVVPSGSGSFIVDDGTTGIFVATTDAKARGAQAFEQDFEGRPEVGMLIEVSGVTSSGGFAPVIIPKRLQKVGAAPLPPVKPVSVTDLQTGRLDCERVRVRGVVQHAEFTGRAIDAARLELAGLGGHFVAYATNPAGFDPAKLIDAEVDLSGVALSFFNERAEFVGARVQLQGVEDVTIVKPAPANAFDVPETRLDALLPFSPHPPSLHRRRVSGVVTVSQPGAFFYVQDGDRAVRVSHAGHDAAHAGRPRRGVWVRRNVAVLCGDPRSGLSQAERGHRACGGAGELEYRLLTQVVGEPTQRRQSARWPARGAPRAARESGAHRRDWAPAVAGCRWSRGFRDVGE